ncbi:MAG: DUF1553 domain-containing protein [Aureliella sp.]
MRIALLCCLVIAWSLTAPSTLAQTNRADAVDARIDFAKQIAPILRRACVECHGPSKQEGDLRLDRREAGSLTATIVPGQPDQSELLRRITLPRGHEEVMPAVGEPLPAAQVEIIRRWIAQGADWPESQASDATHWAYVPPVRPPLPPVCDPAWVRQPLDRFVLARLDQEGLRPAERAAPEKLLRRLFLDLIGLPPSLAEVRAFAADPSDQRLESVVDDLLSRPQFGERWARPWLDAARYADSHGFQRDNLRDMWAYRDWVIQALNEDMPFDQFTIEQIAGDLLPGATERQRIATGFHRCSPTNVEAGSLPEETRIEQVIDRVNTTGAVWLGTTLECCQCHDHKYDPFTQREYYQLLAFFNNTQLEADRSDPKKPSSIEFIGAAMALSDPQRDGQRNAIKQELAELKGRQAARRKQLAASLDAWLAETIPNRTAAAHIHPLEIVDFASEGTTDTLSRLDDGSLLLVGGDPPETDIYRVTARTEAKDIRGFRLEALRHDALPGGGPGRGDAVRRNFVLNDFALELRPAKSRDPADENSAAPDAPAGAVRPVKFASAKASFSQSGYAVQRAIDGDMKTAWAIAPQFDRSHWATFVLEQPLDVPAGYQLVFRLRQTFGQARTIGCLRLSAITGDIDSSGEEGLSSDLLDALAKSPDQRSPAEHKRLLDFRVSRDAPSKRLAGELTKLEKRLGELAPDTTQVMVELPSPRTTTIFQRGDYRQPGPEVEPSTPSVLHHFAGGSDRLALARWLASRDNPLVARVTVNRWWAELFGQGIVATVEDFGIKGDPPTHPELLDWLAVELVDRGWSMKDWLKSVVLSATYQQSSHITPDLQQRDPQNHLLARGPRVRMDAEMIRDNALAIAGLLDKTQFGPPIRPPQPPGIWSKVGGTAYAYDVSSPGQRHRRGIYVVLKRGTPYPSFINFDATSRQTCTLRRSRTNTPLQALTLLNDPVYVEAAEALAERVERELVGCPLPEKLDAMFQLCTARRPTLSERQTLEELYAAQLSAARERSPATIAEAESAARRSVAVVLLNLHETITKD